MATNASSMATNAPLGLFSFGNLAILQFGDAATRPLR
jgi:hypothetical protein